MPPSAVHQPTQFRLTAFPFHTRVHTRVRGQTAYIFGCVFPEIKEKTLG